MSERAGDITRRELMGRVGKAAVVAGLATWTIPEILVATPAAAAGMSPAPGSTPPGSSGGIPPGSIGGGTTGGAVGTGGKTEASGSTGGTGGSGAKTGASGGGGGAGVTTGSAGSHTGTGSSATSAPSSMKRITASGPVKGPSGSSGLDAEDAAAIAAGAVLVSGGWVVTRWASRRKSGTAPPEPEPPVTP